VPARIERRLASVRREQDWLCALKEKTRFSWLERGVPSAANHLNCRNPCLLIPSGFAHNTGAPPEHERYYDDNHPLNVLSESGLGSEIPPIATKKKESAGQSRSNNKYVVADKHNANGHNYNGNR
jgi:hypothetical protein